MSHSSSQQPGPGHQERGVRTGLQHRQWNPCKGTLPGDALRAMAVLWLHFNSVLYIGRSALKRTGAAGGTRSQRRSYAPWHGSVTSSRALKFRTRTSWVLQYLKRSWCGLTSSTSYVVVLNHDQTKIFSNHLCNFSEIFQIFHHMCDPESSQLYLALPISGTWPDVMGRVSRNRVWAYCFSQCVFTPLLFYLWILFILVSSRYPFFKLCFKDT